MNECEQNETEVSSSALKALLSCCTYSTFSLLKWNETATLHKVTCHAIIVQKHLQYHCFTIT